IFKFGFTKIVYQGYSEAADSLIEVLGRNLGSAIQQYVVTHVTTSQFEHHFEMHMLRRMADRLKLGQLHRLGSVKPNFSDFLPTVWPKCIINLPPNTDALIRATPQRDTGVVLLPLENTWRKNLYTNV